MRLLLQVAQLVALLAAAAPALQDEGGDGRELGGPANESAAILARTPDELPRAEAGRWDGLFDAGDAGVVEALDPEVLRGMVSSEQAYRAGDLPAALEGLYDVLEAEPDLPPALLILGTTYFRLRRYGDTVVAFERLLEVAPTEAWRTQALAHAYYSLGDYERALPHYERVIDGQRAVGSEVSPEALRGFALTHLRLGDEERALALLADVVAADPTNWEAHAWSAQIRFDRGELEEARTSAEAARTLAPHEPRPWYVLANVLFELGEDEQADAVEARWRELDSLAQSIRRVRGQLLYQPGSYALAIELVELSRQAGDIDGVREGLDRAIRVIPPDIRRVDVYVYALDTLLAVGDTIAAANAAEALAITCADEADAWRRLELYYALTRDRKRQIEAGEKARRLGGGER